jgi:hypothetical protein
MELDLSTAVTLLIGFYEVLSRIIPTSKKWSLVGIILNALKSISDYLDKRKEQ